MITSTGSRLNISDVAIELGVPREIPADSWSLFQISEGQELNLESCSLTIRNASDQQTAYHPEVAFVQVKSALPADVVMGRGACDSPCNGWSDRLHCRGASSCVWTTCSRSA